MRPAARHPPVQLVRRPSWVVVRGRGPDRLRSASLMFNPLTKKFHVAHGKEDVNYMMSFVKKS